MTATVLVVDDDEAIRRVLERGLTMSGFDVITAADGLAALDAVREHAPDVMLLDIGMPGLDGVQVTRRLRDDSNDLPICILSARADVDDRVAGLEAGADDYVIKPFALKEVAARLQALLRRADVVAEGDRAGSDGMVEACGIRVDTLGRRAWRDQRELELTRREYELLEVLVRNEGVVLSRDRLLELVWGYDFEVETNVVDVFVGYLRRKLELDGAPRTIQTVRGIGFVLRES